MNNNLIKKEKLDTYINDSYLFENIEISGYYDYLEIKIVTLKNVLLKKLLFKELILKIPKWIIPS